MTIGATTKSPGRGALVTRERVAIALLFMMNGVMIGAWAPRIPEFAARLGLTEATLGLMILVFGLGSIVMMPVAGSQIGRLGSSTVTKITAVLLTPIFLLLSVVGDIWTGAVALFLFGGLSGAMDVAMNANAVATEKSMRRSIMSSCHAFWSLGCLIGASTGGFLIAHMGGSWHAVLVTLLAAALVAGAWRIVLHDAPHPDEAGLVTGRRLPRSALPWLIGIMALFCMIPEGAILDWGALYLRNELDASVSLSGFGYAAFSLTMAVMRFAGDLVRDRFGAVKTFRTCLVIAIFGLLLVGFAQSSSMALVGFALTGIGISNLVPICFSAAGNLPGMAAGVGLSVVTVMGYSGLLVAPSLIGFVAEYTGLASIFSGLTVLLLVSLFLSPLARHADSVHD